MSNLSVWDLKLELGGKYILPAGLGVPVAGHDRVVTIKEINTNNSRPVFTEEGTVISLEEAQTLKPAFQEDSNPTSAPRLNAG